MTRHNYANYSLAVEERAVHAPLVDDLGHRALENDLAVLAGKAGLPDRDGALGRPAHHVRALDELRGPLLILATNNQLRHVAASFCEWKRFP